MTKPPLIISVHLGLGDHIITVPIVRHYAHIHSHVTVLCKPHNRDGVKFMFRDLKNVDVMEARDHGDGERLCSSTKNEVLRLGAHGKWPWNNKEFDKCFYAQASIPFEDRFCMWYVQPPKPSESVTLPFVNEPYAFLHEDTKRGYVIDRVKMGTQMDRVFNVEAYSKVDPQPHIFAFWPMVRNATEFHCLDSSFALWIDSIETPNARRFVIHRSARKGITEWPTYKKNWEVI